MKKTVFISSTYEDLKQHRAKIWEVLQKYDVSIRGMEQFGARKEAPLETCMAEVEQSDIYIGIIAMRLGSIDRNTGKSFTQLEYEKAYELGKEMLIYLFDEQNGKIPPIYVDFDENHEKLEAFKSILKERHTIDTFVDEADICEKLRRRFNELLAKKDIENNEVIDEYIKSADIIQKLCLFPKVHSGREIKLKIKLEGKPFPASKELCNSFNLDYGKTVGTRIKIIEPKLGEDVAEFMFVDYKLAEDFLKIERDKNLEVYAKMLFSEDNIDKVKANFVQKIYPQGAQVGAAQIGTWFNKQLMPITTIPAEGKIILVLKNIHHV